VATEARCDVLVVGAGPVGMTAALLLAARGVRVGVIEKNKTTADDPKAISLDDESLRVYQQAGVESDVLNVIVPGTGTMYFDATNERLFHARAAVPFRSGYPFKNPFAQPDLERVLCEALRREALVTLRFGTELESFTQSSDGVEATVRRESSTEIVRARYILGADGGRSRVRSTLGVEMIGHSHEDVWLVVDCLEDTRSERYGMHHADPARPHVVVPGLDGRCRYEFYTYPDECNLNEPQFELIEKLLAPYRTITPDQIERAVAYKFHALNAKSWRSNKAFLLGDAAHMMPPFAGQGLNSGIRDAANIAWKLADVLSGRANDSILDTYEDERRPHAQAVIHSSERLGRVVMTRNVRLARYRDAVVHAALGSPEGRTYFEEMRYRPTTRITNGLVFEPSSHSLVGTQIGQPTVFSIFDRQQLPFDRLLGSFWALVGVGVDNGDWRKAVNVFDAKPLFSVRYVDVPLDDTLSTRRFPINVAVDLDNRLYEEFATARGCFVLIRPDHFVAAVVAPERLDELAAAITNRYAASPLDARPKREGMI
jgi:3-(3-hydroxy-phenyl)propionate hydroxylase